jgi:hypothetical protein
MAKQNKFIKPITKRCKYREGSHVCFCKSSTPFYFPKSFNNAFKVLKPVTKPTMLFRVQD